MVVMNSIETAGGIEPITCIAHLIVTYHKLVSFPGCFGNEASLLLTVLWLDYQIRNS